MKRACLVMVALVLAGCETRGPLPPLEAPAPSAPSSSQPSAAHRPKAPLPPVQSAGPLTKNGVEVYMDAQESDLRNYLRGQGVRVARRGNEIALSVASDRLFVKTAISDWGDAFARAMVQVLAHYDHTAVEIACYTDARGDAEQNLALSQKRAKALADSLSGYGVAASRITASGFGAANSRSTNPNDPKNRRIEIKIVPRPS